MRARHAVSLVRLLSAIGLTVAIGSTATAQSLGELAKKEEARRKTIKTSGKVLTNDTLRSTPAPLSTAASPLPASPDKASTPDADKTDKKAKPEEDRKTQEASWRAKMQGARDTLQRSQMFAEALQSRINGLSADFTSRDDANQRDVVGRDRQKALAELEKVKDEIVQQTKAIADLQEEARKAGVPPGWLR